MSSFGYLDCVGGVAGDMLLAALLDAGADEARLRELPRRLGFDDLELRWETRRSHGFAARHVQVIFEPPAHPPHRGLAEVRAILEAAELDAAVRARALGAFTRLATAEAQVHGATLETVHFHEVGAVDAIVDIVGVCELCADLGLERLRASSLPMGRGTVDCAHGRLPLPAPAVLAMLDGVPVHDAGIEGETVTPTGIALLRELCAEGGFGPLPAMTVQRSGLGCGSKERPGIPNIVRLIVGELPTQGEKVTLGRAPGAAAGEQLLALECNLDDLDPRLMPGLFEALYQAGALDVLVLPALMKKGRPGQLLQALCRASAREALAATLFRESTTFGLRWYPVERAVLAREQQQVDTPWGPVEVKVALDGDGEPLRCTPEHDSCAALAAEAGVPLAQVFAAAQAAWLHARR